MKIKCECGEKIWRGSTRCKKCATKERNRLKFQNNCKKLIEKYGSCNEFYSYAQAAKHFELDSRTVKQYENIIFSINKNLPPKNAQKVKCKICKKDSLKSLARNGYCKKCTQKGLGFKERGKKLSKQYKGKNNPNYSHGKTKQSILDRKNQWENWGKYIFKECDYTCSLSGRKDDLQCHHIIPFSLYPEYRFEKWNGIVLNRFYHIELHRLQLDIQLLPSLSESKLDALQLREWFVHQPQVQSLLQLPYQLHDQHELIRVVGQKSNYHKQISLLHPEFDPFSLALKV